MRQNSGKKTLNKRNITKKIIFDQAENFDLQTQNFLCHKI